ncbi:tryptophan--tRNA ligase [Algisphaera agarilytica]|uniref:Tryptophan--tRNA ligase n=1 Tax=Algisphaera agarilytica TaxID=1385975 RepID=A0A7X0H7X5_9BACT|nr:tryptophan--tRNA ligase [Algisphaera agarilytica]MBB6430901.1 tryptophanyl-tRNA synthetase [Algisphaera agarilytica]
MKRVLSGLQPSGQLHLGNYAGAIKQFVDLQHDHEMFVFVASYHALTTIKDPAELRANIRQVVIDYLAFGLDADLPHVNIYLQQDVPAVTELTWLLSCVCPKSQMDKATTYKDKVAKGISASVGLFTYPILQAADILGVAPDIVPVGEDQRQHVEITRDLAQRFNHAYASEDDPVFKVPDVMVRADAGVLPGLDGEKMSKSYGNIIDPFLPEKKLRKTIMKIVSDSTPMEEPKDPEADTTFKIFRAIAGAEDQRTTDLAAQYRAGNFGYGHAKQALFELLLDHFGDARERREKLMQDPGYVEQVLRSGAEQANEVLSKVLEKARTAVGL